MDMYVSKKKKRLEDYLLYNEIGQKYIENHFRK